MNFLGNLIWMVFGGLFTALSWFFVGILWSITIIGIPVGKQCFKLAGLALFPFGKRVVTSNENTSLILNILWIVFGGFELAISHFLLGIVFYITIIGIPFGKQHFKLAQLSLLPFGAKIIS